ncbi:FAD-binding oxidoreductase [Streptomyces ipomoeae]|jgi:FAD/FMN-containing dehydrogenase|uniref:FAD binding domain protein n=1 Tax=Streptomyces ipomoeae 91-03 TaxID=698759 RepID=L1KUA4_9ACTN|nr:FAD-binding oxidoreductase [Streptomyces ipomoeae]EKX64371.1 FAD binding domain protein [Streptomyces ipomoeae 91-03]MDX2693021.1 FAD-binding oxidoreductase [Streptomyces ipomoeae]MDX2820805.1 FAD-binding oxidoreductase [Streptomyces ipomoeae]MDX2838527.1 FAD-binding oxidoreductase [Streptomyces ipomoeae]MDX2872583.1 FAD-binding oxidoreductase [Streptomyces ipomoeae]
MTDWEGLREQVDGTVRLPGEPGFEENSSAFNKRYADVRPAGVLSVASVADVARGIAWAREQGLPVVARGGGHSYAGQAASTGLVLDLRGLNTVTVDRERELVTVGGGAVSGELYAELQRHDLAVPLGNSDEVGIGGLTLGGGVAAVSRAFGLTCDSLVETEVVLADGTLVTCNETDHADLFWACKGGGGGNFGINTSFTFQARPTVASSTCLVVWPLDDAEAVLPVMQRIMRDAPDRFAARIGVSRSGDDDGIVSVIGQHLGPASELRELLAPALKTGSPSTTDIEDRSYWEAKDYLRHETSGDPFAVRTRTVTEPLTEAGVDTILTALRKWPGSGNPDGAGIALFTWGGAINRVPVTETAFPHRDVLFLISMDTSWSTEDPERVRRDNLEWLTELHAAMGEHARDASYVNFADPDLPEAQAAYFGPNLDRLREIKHRYDPERVFTFNQAI